MLEFIDSLFEHVVFPNYGCPYDRITVFGEYLYCSPIEFIGAVAMAVLFALVFTFFIMDIIHSIQDLNESEPEEEVIYKTVDRLPECGDLVYDLQKHCIGYYLTDILGEDNNLYALYCTTEGKDIELCRCPKCAITVVAY